MWRRGGRLSLTIVVKATLALVNDGVARLGRPVELFQGERTPRPGASIVSDGDLVPYKPRVDVTYVGFAWAPRPVQGLTARLGVHGEAGVLERALQVVGERASATAQPSPFVRMPLVYERAWTGLQGENPLGVPPRSGRIANLFDPSDPSRPACFAPVGRAFPVRQRLLGAHDPRALETPSPDPSTGVWAVDVPASLPFEYFLSSPADQRLDHLNGDETVLLENLVEGQSRLYTKLPGIRALARVFGATLPPSGQSIDLIADTLAIDGADKTLSITWRGTIPVPDADTFLRSLHVLTGVELPGYPMQWPASRPGPRAEARPAPVMSEEPTPMLGDDEERSGSTKAISPEDAMKLLAGAKKALPFGGLPPPPAPPPPAPPPPDVAPGRVERTLSPDESAALARRLAEPAPAPVEAEPALRRPKVTGRMSRAAVAKASETARPPQPAVAPAAPIAPPPPVPAPIVPPLAPPPAMLAPAPPAFVAPQPPTGRGRGAAPDLVVRAANFDDAPTGSMDDEDSSIGSTVAFSPEAAAELIARQSAKLAAKGGAPAAPTGGGRVPPAPPSPAPRGGFPAPHAPDDDAVDSSAGSTVAFSPEAAAELIAKRMAQLGGAGAMPRAPHAAPPAPPPPAPPPPAPPPPAQQGPTLTRSNTLVMDAPETGGSADPRPPRGGKHGR